MSDGRDVYHSDTLKSFHPPSPLQYTWSPCVESVEPSDWSSHHSEEGYSKEPPGSRQKLLSVKTLRYWSCLLLQHRLSLSLLILRGRPEMEGNISNLKSTIKERKPDSEEWRDGSHAFVFPSMKSEFKNDL